MAKSSQLNTRLGIVSGRYTGPVEGNFFVPNAIDVEFCLFLKPHKTINFRSLLALELPEAKPFYTYAGIGIRHYLGSSGLSFNRSENGFNLSSIPTKRYYIGYDIGISQAIVKSYGTVLQAVSLMLDVGVTAGATYQINGRLGIDLSVGASAAFGFSSVGSVGAIWRAMIGTTYTY